MSTSIPRLVARDGAPSLEARSAGTSSGTAGRARPGPDTMDWLRRLGALVLLPALIVVAWWVLSAGSRDPFFPSLERIGQAFVRVWISPNLTEDVLPSLRRLGLGLSIAAVVGIVGGVVIGSSTRLRLLLEPTMGYLRALPSPALLPALLLLFGVGDEMKVAMIALGCTWAILLSTVDGVRGVDEVQRDIAAVHRLSRAQRLRHLVLPAAAPRIAAGFRQALATAVVLMVISEMLLSTNGLGYTVVQFQRSFALPEMWSGMLFLAILGAALSGVYVLLERRLLAWHHGLRRQERRS